MRVMGLSSGTSVDAIDLAVVEFTRSPAAGRGSEELSMRLVAHGEHPWPQRLRADLLAALPPAGCDVATWCRLDTLVGQEFGAAARWAIDQWGGVDLVTSHGQTLHHWVEDGTARGSLQIGNPAWIHQATAVPVVSDLRIADIAAGGQGAPLVSLLDAMWLGGQPTAALNLGGIANVTLVDGDRVVCGDTGPANCLMDAVMALRGERCDLDGRHAAAGTLRPELLERLLADPWFATPLPRSTGREVFHPGWLLERADGLLTEADLADAGPAGDDLLATLAELSARTIADQLRGRGMQRLVVSGGGARNPELLRRIEAASGLGAVRASGLGIPDDAKEACLFALLGYLAVNGWPGTWPTPEGRTVTGATAARVLGSLTPVAPLAGGAPTRLVVDERTPRGGAIHG